MKNIILAAVLAFTTQNTFAYSPFPLTFEWFGSLYEGFQEEDQEIWRGKIIDVVNSTEIIVENINGHKSQVKLLHLSPPKNNNDHTIRVMTYALTSLIGNNVYVLGEPNKENITARLVDRKGKDINLQLVRAGAFDVNTTTLHFKKSKQAYIKGVQNAKSLQRGIWFNM